MCFKKHACASMRSGTIDWLREHRVSLLLFNTWGHVPLDPVATMQAAESDTGKTAKPEHVGTSPATPVSTDPVAAPSAEPERPEVGTLVALEWATITVEQTPLPLLEHKDVLHLLHGRVEWGQHRVEIKRRVRSKGNSFYDVACLDTVDCTKRWRAFYITERTDVLPPGTLHIQSQGEHTHSAERGTTKLFSAAQLAVAEGFVQAGGSDLRGLQLAFNRAKFAEASLPTSKQLSNWLKRAKNKTKLATGRQAHLVAVVEMELASVPRSMPDDTTTLFLLETPILSDTEACILFSCRGMVEQLHRYSDEVLCCTVDTKMKVAHHGYGVATFGILTKDKLRKTSLAGPTGRTQALAPTSHALPIAQAIIHQETDMNYQRLFRKVDELWQASKPGRTPLADMEFQLHKDFKKEIESARIACFPKSRACDDFFHWTQKQHTTMATKCQQVVLKAGKWVKKALPWALAAVRLLRMLPTLPLLSDVWHALLQRLQADDEPHLVSWLKTYERPVPSALAARYASSSQFKYVSFWSGLHGTVPGSGSGSQPAEAMHSPWQRQLTALGGAGSVGHVLTVMQKLYKEHWQNWYNFSSAAALSFTNVVLGPDFPLDMSI